MVLPYTCSQTARTVEVIFRIKVRPNAGRPHHFEAACVQASRCMDTCSLSASAAPALNQDRLSEMREDEAMAECEAADVGGARHYSGFQIREGLCQAQFRRQVRICRALPTSGLSTCSVMPLSRVADSASVSLSNDSVEVAPGISVTPHNVTVSFKKKQEKVWDSLPGMGSMCWRDLPRRLVPRVHA